jgi:hypothetical protein
MSSENVALLGLVLGSTKGRGGVIVFETSLSSSLSTALKRELRRSSLAGERTRFFRLIPFVRAAIVAQT